MEPTEGGGEVPVVGTIMDYAQPLSPANTAYRVTHGKVGDGVDLYERHQSVEREFDLLDRQEQSIHLDMEKLCKDLRSREEVLQRLRHFIEHFAYALFDVIFKHQHAVATNGVANVSMTRTTHI